VTRTSERERDRREVGHRRRRRPYLCRTGRLRATGSFFRSFIRPSFIRSLVHSYRRALISSSGLTIRFDSGRSRIEPLRVLLCASSSRRVLTVIPPAARSRALRFRLFFFSFFVRAWPFVCILRACPSGRLGASFPSSSSVVPRVPILCWLFVQAAIRPRVAVRMSPLPLLPPLRS